MLDLLHFLCCVSIYLVAFHWKYELFCLGPKLACAACFSVALSDCVHSLFRPKQIFVFDLCLFTVTLIWTDTRLLSLFSLSHQQWKWLRNKKSSAGTSLWKRPRLWFKRSKRNEDSAHLNLRIYNGHPLRLCNSRTAHGSHKHTKFTNCTLQNLLKVSKGCSEYLTFLYYHTNFVYRFHQL